MSAILALRDYQREGVEAVEAAWARGMRRPAVSWPTGAGKTVGFAHLGARWLAANASSRVLALAHTTELVDQMISKFRSVAPGVNIGRVQANVNETLAPIICASVATLRRQSRRDMLRSVGMMIVDECHHSTSPSYRTILEHYGAFAPAGDAGAVAVGFTATMERADEASLGEVWQDVVAYRSIVEMINAGYLVRPRGIHVRVDDLDLSGVRSSGGDWREGELGSAIENSLAPEAIAKAIAEHADDRRILLFAPTVNSARVIAEVVGAAGRSVGVIWGEMDPRERSRVLGDFRAGNTQVLCNCMILTEGFDDPASDCVVIARPTKSPVLYKQMAGRVLRPYPGKTDALLLDVVGATKSHSLAAGINLFGLTDSDGEGIVGKPVERDGGAEREDLGQLRGPLVTTDVDLFSASPMQWLRTRAGVFFLEAGERYIAIVPGAQGGYDVTAMHKTRAQTGSWIVNGVADLSYAMGWAEQAVSSAERMTATKARAWRAKAPSDKTKALAARLNVPVADGASQGEVSNMISLRLASRRIDPHIPAWVRKG